MGTKVVVLDGNGTEQEAMFFDDGDPQLVAEEHPRDDSTKLVVIRKRGKPPRNRVTRRRGQGKRSNRVPCCRR